MIDYKKILQMHFDHTSQRTIESALGHSRHTISDVIKRSQAKGITELTEEMDNKWLFGLLYPERQAFERGYYPVNWEYIHKELMKKNVTLQLLHREYTENSRHSKKFPYSYTSFCRGYKDYARKYDLTMPIKRKPGELVELDWAGSVLYVQNHETGELDKAYLFVATLPFSQYFYVEAFMDMKVNNWLTGHIHAFKYFKGVPETLVPDNLKTGVTKADRYEPVLNAAYRQLADHFQTVIVPARVKRPKDKASTEGTVGYVSRYIIGTLRNYQCFSIKDLNKKIHELMEEMNHAPFQKRVGSRYSVFTQDEQPLLRPLPRNPFQLAEWRVAKVQRNYHVQIEKNYYSTPFEYVQDDVDIKLTPKLIEIYYKDLRIATHVRITDLVGQYSTDISHMPDSHRKYYEQTPEQALEWAKKIGIFTEKLVKKIFETTSEKQALRSVQVLKKSLKKYSEIELEVACQTASEAANAPTGQLVNTILARNQARSERSGTSETKRNPNQDYGFTRGAGYYGGGSHDE